MGSIKSIFYFISGFFLLISISFAIFDRALYDRFGEDYFILFIPYWLSFGCAIILVGWSMQIYQERNSRKKIRLLEKENDKLKAKMYDLMQSQEYTQSAQIAPKQSPHSSKEEPDQSSGPNNDTKKEEGSKPGPGSKL